MHICMALPDAYPPDVRVHKEARALLDAGHGITLLCGGRSGPRREVIDGVDVIRVYRGGTLPEVRRTASAVSNLVRSVYPNWRRELADVLRDTDADALHVHDLPLLKTALNVAGDHDVPVVADLHENYPEAVRQWRRPVDGRTLLENPRQLAHRLCRPIHRLERLERQCVQGVDRLVTVVEEAERHYVEDCGVPPERTRIVSNVVDLGRFDPSGVEPVEHDEEDFRLTYVGGFAPHRGLETAIEAMQPLAERVRQARLVLVGSGDDAYEQRLRTLAADRDVDDDVTFTGWVDYDAVPAQIAASDVCLVPHDVNPHTNTTVPHKLFQYMAMGKPVLVTDAVPLERIVSGTESGRVVPGGDARAMAEAAAELAENPERADQLGSNGRAAVRSRYNWQREREVLLRMYASIEP